MPVSPKDSPRGSGDSPSDGRPPPQGGRPPGWALPQLILEGTLRRSQEADVITFRLPPLLRLIDLTCVVIIPRAGKTKAPVYLRFFLDKEAGDPPGSVVIDG